jgi:hypothetical protein
VNSLGTDFNALLTRAAICTLGAVACWALLVVATVAVEARTRGRIRLCRRTGCPATVRRWLLAMFLALFAGVSPAQASDTGSGNSDLAAGALDGLALPDRPVDARIPHHPVGTRQVVVQPGDSLWRIVRDALPADTPDSVIAAAVAAVHADNRSTIGPDPGLLQPGQRLDLAPLLDFPVRTTLSEAP